MKAGSHPRSIILALHLAGVAAVIAGAAVLPSAATAEAAAQAPAPGAKPSGAHVSASAAASPEAPFARVYLAIRGCTSCSHCRANIRQMVRANSEGGEARLHDDQVEVRYPKPRAIPLREVIRSLADNRLHDLSLVDVLFEGVGSITTAADGSVRFTLQETGQAFPVILDARVSRPRDGKPVRLVAVVNGWREKQGLTLTAREIREET